MRSVHSPTTAARRRRRFPIVVLLLAVGMTWFAVGGPVPPASAASAGKISGVVRDTAGAIVANAPVALAGSSATPVRTTPAGAYTINNVPAGEHTVSVFPVCKPAVSLAVAVDGDKNLNFTVQERNTADSFGYACRSTRPLGLGNLSGTGLTGDDEVKQVNLPFSFPFYGTQRTTAFLSTNGFLSFTAASTAFDNTAIPAAGGPNAAIYGFWDDLVVDGPATVATAVFGSAPFREFTVRWSEVRVRAGAPGDRVSFEIKLSEDGAIEIINSGNFGPTALTEGSSATMGIENDAGTVGVQDSFNVRHLLVGSDSSVRYEPNRAPIADAGEFFGTAAPGSTLPLNGTASFDPDGDVLRYAWKQTGGPTSAIVDPTSPKTTVKAPANDVGYQLRVVDSYGASDTSSIFFDVQAPK